MATRKIRKFGSGGDTDKEEGLRASKGEDVGFFERIRMGNIDDPESEAYKRFGAGRGRAERAKSAPVEVAEPPISVTPRAAASSVEDASQDMLGKAKKQGERQETGDASVAEDYQGPRTSVASITDTSNTAPAKSGPKKSVKAKTSSKPDTSNYSNEGRSKKAVASGADSIPSTGNPTAPKGERVEPMSDTERNIQNMLAVTGVGGGALGAMYKGKKMLDARKALKAGAKKRANLKRDVEEGIERNLADEFQSLAAAAPKAAAKSEAKKQLASDRTRDLAAGQAKTKFTSTPKNTSKKTKKFDDESNIEFKRGGLASKTSNASRRADGIASKGKTRCKIC